MKAKIFVAAVIAICLAVVACLVIWERRPNGESELMDGVRHQKASTEIVSRVTDSPSDVVDTLKDVESNSSNDIGSRISEYRKVGYGYMMKQRDYVSGIEDDAQRRALDSLVTRGNQVLLAAVIQEMVADEEYRQYVYHLFNDGEFRRFAIDVMGRYVPKVADYLKTGNKVTPDELAELFGNPVDYVSIFDEAIRPDLPPELGEGYEKGISHTVAADVLHWNEIHRGRGDAEGATFFWGERYHPIK